MAIRRGVLALVVAGLVWACGETGGNEADAAVDLQAPDTAEETAAPDLADPADADGTDATADDAEPDQGPDAAPDTTDAGDDTAPSTGTVSGTARRFKLDDAAGITVRLKDTAFEATAAADGAFAFADVPAGTYTLVAEAAPYQPAEVTDVTVTAGAAASLDVTLYLGRALYAGADAVVGQPLPDETHTVFATAYSFMTQVGDLWVFDSVGADAVPAADDVFFGALMPSPAGSKLLFAKNMTFANGLSDVWAWDFARGSALPLAEQSSPGVVRFSADEEVAVLGANVDPMAGTGDLRVVDFAAGQAFDVATACSVQWLSLAADGSRLAFLRDVDAGTNSGTLAVWDAATNQVSDVLQGVSQWGMVPVTGTDESRLWLWAAVDGPTNLGDLYFWDQAAGAPRLMGHGTPVNQMVTNASLTRVAFAHDVQTFPDTGLAAGTLATWLIGSADQPVDVATGVDPYSAALPQDGARVSFRAHPAGDPNVTDLGVWNADDGSVVMLATGANVGSSTDGGDHAQAFLTDVDEATQRGTLWTYRYGDAAAVRVADQVARDVLTFGPGGRHLLYKKGEGPEGFDPATFLGALWAVDVDTGTEVALGTGAASVNWWSPDGRLVGFVDHVLDLTTYAGDVRLFDLAAGVGVKLADGGTGDQMQYSADGATLLHFRGCASMQGAWACGLDAYELGVQPDVTALQPTHVHEGIDPWSYRFTPDGSAVLLFAPSDANGHGDVLLYDLATHAVQVVATNGSFYDTTSSEDGQWLRVVANGGFPVGDLWLWNLVTRQGTLLGEQVHLQSARMTADWSRALFLAHFGGEGDLGTLMSWNRDLGTARLVAEHVPWFTVHATTDLAQGTFQTEWDAGASAGTLWAVNLEGDAAPVPLDAPVPLTSAVFAPDVLFPVYGDGNPRAGVYVAPLP